MKIFKIILLVLIMLFVSSNKIYAKKSLFGGKRGGGAVSAVFVSPRLRPDRLALIVNFANLLKTSSVSYSLTYNTLGVPQAVVGSIRPTVDSTQRELLFGTCSSGVCRYHTNLTNMRFIVTINLFSGGRIVKRYTIKP